MVLLDELTRQCEVLGGLPPTLFAESAEEKIDVQEYDYEVVKGTERLLLDRKCAVAVRLVATFHLHADSFC